MKVSATVHAEIVEQLHIHRAAMSRSHGLELDAIVDSPNNDVVFSVRSKSIRLAVIEFSIYSNHEIPEYLIEFLTAIGRHGTKIHSDSPNFIRFRYNLPISQ